MTKTVLYVKCTPLNSNVESLTLPLHHCLPHTENKILYLPLVIINPKTLKTNIKCLELHFFLAHLTLYQNHDLILQENNVHAIPIEIASLGSHPNKQ